MSKLPLLSVFVLPLIMSLQRVQVLETGAPSPVDTTKPKNAYTNRTVSLFGDTSYTLTIDIYDTSNYDEETYNSTLTFRHRENKKTDIFFRDSLYCLYPEIEFKDFNNDKTKDVLVFYYTGGRANPTYHLYLTDSKNRKLIRVKGFEELPNPFMDTESGIITSIALSGSNYYSFYKINSKNKLINLGHSYEENPNDSTQYERAIRKILKENK